MRLSMCKKVDDGYDERMTSSASECLSDVIAPTSGRPFSPHLVKKYGGVVEVKPSAGPNQAAMTSNPALSPINSNPVIGSSSQQQDTKVKKVQTALTEELKFKLNVKPTPAYQLFGPTPKESQMVRRVLNSVF